jgi:hypothetical protein
MQTGREANFVKQGPIRGLDVDTYGCMKLCGSYAQAWKAFQKKSAGIFFRCPHILSGSQNGARTKSGVQLQHKQQIQPMVPTVDDLGATGGSNYVCKG